MRRIFSLFLILAVSVTLASCQSAGKKQIRKVQEQLNQTDALIQGRKLNGAIREGYDALKTINVQLNKDPDNVSLRILHARAHLTIFVAKNLLNFENSEPRPKSLVRLPEIKELKDFDPHVLTAELDLVRVLNSGEELTPQQEAAVYTMLGMTYRFQEAQVLKANRAYGAAIRSYRNWLDTLQKENSKLEPKRFAIMAVKNQLAEVELAQVEVNLLGHRWAYALRLLEQMMGGQDLKYFPTQFRELENRIATIETELRNDFDESRESREKKLAQAVLKARSGSVEPDTTPLGLNAYEVELIRTENELTLTKNNLIYRSICYYQLDMEEEYKEARGILKEFYPSLDEGLDLLAESKKGGAENSSSEQDENS